MLTMTQAREICSFLFDATAAKQLPAVRGKVLAALPEALDKFYDIVWNVEELRAILKDRTRIDGLKRAQQAHWQFLFDNGPTDAYIERAKRVGVIHFKVGLSPQWYIASYGWLIRELLSALSKRGIGSGNNPGARIIFSLFTLDMLIAVSVFEGEEVQEELRHQQNELSVKNLKETAATIAQINDAAVVLAELTRSSIRASENSQTISAASEQLTASVQEITRNSSKTSEEAGEASHAVADALTLSNNAGLSMEKIAETSLAVSENMGRLVQASEQIEQILSVIGDIASQTNLLALNATIEAARAGEAGKGFAVVASEVKNLANQTSKATEDVSKRIDALKRGVGTIVQTTEQSVESVQGGREAIVSIGENISGVSTQIETVAANMSEISAILQQQQEASAEVASRISDVANLSQDMKSQVVKVGTSLQEGNKMIFEIAKNWYIEGSERGLCEIAKIDHVLFKKRVVDTLMDAEEWHAEQVPDHHSCRLGKWYDSVTDPVIQKSAAFQALLEPHTRVHAQAKKALDCHDAHDPDGAVAALQDVNGASHEVLDLLEQLSQFMKEQGYN